MNEQADLLTVSLLFLASIAFGLLAGFLFFQNRRLNRFIETAEADAEKLLAESRKEAEEIKQLAKKQAKNEQVERRKKFEAESKNRRSEISTLENKIKQRETSLNKKLGILDDREKKLGEQSQQLENDQTRFKKLEVEGEAVLEKAQSMLERISHMSPEEAKQELVKSMESKAREKARESIRRIETETKLEADRISQSIISSAVQRAANDYVNDSTVTVVSLPSDDMKGRIIGREGRNIRAIEQATGIDLIIDDTPEAVIISCFNPIRREIAKITLQRLIKDGRIHPARILETANRVEKEFDTIIFDQGEQAAFDCSITDIHPELIRHLGKLKYRYNAQQNVLTHSIEVANISAMIAAEMRLDPKIAKRAGLLHEIGRAVDQDTEGHHADLGAQLCEKYSENYNIVSAIRVHLNSDLTQANPYAVVLNVANLLSTNRPGARKEILDSYINRLEEMEKLVKSFKGIEEAFVIQAGREVRAIVSPIGVSDQEVVDLSQDIAAKLREEITFPGQVQVTVSRESQAMDYAT